MTDNCTWIVGGSTGIGRELALQLADLGEKVLVSARSEDNLKEVQNLRPEYIKSIALDVTDEKAVASTVATLFNSGNAPKTVYLNAGIYHPMSVKNFSASTAARMMTVNYLGTMNVIENILPHYINAKSGHIVVVASVAGYQGLPMSLGYGPTKAALINLCEGLHLELHGSGVKIQVVNPGFVKTPLTANNKFPMPFLMEVEEAARRIVKGAQTSSFEIIFPRRFAIILKTLGLLPYGISLPLIRKLTR
jgi:short-subunit dehydrogenase